MTYKIPDPPSPNAYNEELADFWEVQALCNPDQYISNAQISRILTTGLDEIDHSGIDSESDQLLSNLDEVFYELERRQDFAHGKYPFSFKKYSIKLNDETSIFRDVYLYMLLCTRLNMNTSKTHNDIDGTLLFEELCAEVAPLYFGPATQSYVFGTANSGNFSDKINDLIEKIGEGIGFKNPNNNSPSQQDDAVDIVTWKNFADNRIGKLIAFGQCKTGTHWHDSIHLLKPNNFCNNWFKETPILKPIPLVFICDTLNENLNFATSQRGYLFFNRFRILEQIDGNLNSEITGKIRLWLQGALRTSFHSEVSLVF